VVTPEDWDQMKEHIQFSYVADNHFAELKDNEMLNERLGLVAQMDPYLGKYFSIDYIRRQILKQTETEIDEINEQMEQEIADGIIPDPAMMNDPMAMMGGMPGQPMGAPMGQPQQQLPPGPDQADYTRGQF